MQAYIIRRLILAIPTLLLVSMIIFATVRFIPGTALDLMVAEMAEESGMGHELTVEWIKHELGMDQPIYVQYGKWLWAALQGDLGNSIWTDRSVTGDLMARFPVTLELTIIAIITGLLISLPVGIVSAIRQDTLVDYGGRSIAILSMSLPPFWIGTMVVVIPSIVWGWAPEVEYIPLAKDPGRNLFQFLIPGVIQGMYLTGHVMRMMRTMMLEVLRQDYIRTAWSKGLRERTVVMRHTLKNALLPVITLIGIQVPSVLAATVVIESIFCLPGIGLFLVEAINKRDYPVISGINVLIATIVLFMNLTIDMTYAWLDPRIKY